MNKDIDVSSLKIDLYSDKSVRDFTADVAQKDGRMWLSNVSAEIAAEAAALAVKALRKSGLEDADMKNAEHFIEVLRKFFLKTSIRSCNRAPSGIRRSPRAKVRPTSRVECLPRARRSTRCSTA